jgi:uncharacterized protein YbjT (DUF2867 family)
MHVLVTGATGFVGQRLVPRLVSAGHDVQVLVRDPDGYDPPAEVSVTVGDLLERESLAGCCDGVDAAYYLVHSMGASGDFAARDRRAAENFISVASDAGVSRAMYLGGLGHDDETEMSAHLRSRREVERILASTGVALTTLRAAIIIGDGSASFDMVRQLCKRLPVMVTPRWVTTPCQPIAIDDVIAYLAGVLDAPGTAGDTYDIGGPDVLTYGSILQRTAEVMGRRPPILIPVPVLSPTLSSYWIGLVTDVPTSVARPLIKGLKTPVVADDERITNHVDVAPTPFEDAVATALAEGDEPGPQSPTAGEPAE